MNVSVRCGLALASGFMVACLALSPSFSAGALGAGRQDTTAAAAGETVHYPSGDINIDAYMAKPSGGGKHPAVIVLHDNTGLNQPMKDAVNSLAAAGFVAIAPDLVSRARSAPKAARPAGGGGEGEEGMGGGAARGPAAQLAQISPDQTIEDVKAAFTFLQMDSAVDATKISAIGFGWGGWRIFKLAEETPTLHRAVVYYGTTPILDDDLTKVKIPVQAHYAQYDFQVTGNSLWTEKMLGKTFTYYIYPDTSRGFYVGNGNQPATAAKGNADAEKQAWTRTVDFLKH